MIFGQKTPFPPMEPKVAANVIVNNIGKDIGVVYLPGWWRWIMLVFQCLPWVIFRKLKV